MVLFFSVIREGKCEINLKKKKIFFLLSGAFLTIFGR